MGSVIALAPRSLDRWAHLARPAIDRLLRGQLAAGRPLNELVALVVPGLSAALWERTQPFPTGREEPEEYVYGGATHEALEDGSSLDTLEAWVGTRTWARHALRSLGVDAALVGSSDGRVPLVVRVFGATLFASTEAPR